jgi:hypothetical protein
MGTKRVNPWPSLVTGCGGDGNLKGVSHIYKPTGIEKFVARKQLVSLSSLRNIHHHFAVLTLIIFFELENTT